MKEWVPLLQTLSWIGLIIIGTRTFSAQLISLFYSILLRIAAGSSFKAGPELGDDLHRLQIIDQNKPRKDKGIGKWKIERNEIYKKNQGIFLIHVIQPLNKRTQLYDIFI